MNNKLLFVLTFILTLFICFTGLNINQNAFADEESGFKQGAGYEGGAYGKGGIPTWNNWNRMAPYAGPLTKPTKQWEVELTGVHNEGGIAVAPDGTCYVTSWDGDSYTGYLYSISSNGTLNWKKAYAEGWCPIVPTIGMDGMLYVASYYKYGEILPGSDNKEFDGKLEKLNPTDYATVWTYSEIPGKILSQPILDKDGNSYFVTHNNSRASWTSNDIFAIKPDGSLKWSGLLSGSNYSFLVLGAKGYLYTVTGDNTNVRPYKLMAISKNDGSLKASFMPSDGGTLGGYPFLGKDGTLYISAASYYKVYALDPVTLKEKRSGDAFSFSPYAQAPDGLLWSQGGTSRGEDLNSKSNALGMNLNTLSKNGYFGYLSAWGNVEMRGKYPDFTDAWIMKGEELENSALYLAVVPRDGWIYAIERQVSTSKLVGYYGSIKETADLRAITLKTTPENSVGAGDNVKLTGTASGGNNVEYKFTIAKADTIGNYETEKVLRDFSASSTYNWKAETGSYKIFVYGRSKGESDEKKSTECYYYVTVPQKYSATMSATPSQNAKINKTITLKIKSKGFKNPEYRYSYWSMKDHKDIIINNWSKKTVVYWKPKVIGDYSIRVEVREKLKTSERVEAFSFVQVIP